MARGVLDYIGRRLAAFLGHPIKGFMPLTTTNPAAFRRTLRRGDVVLVEGNTRVSTAIKYLTQSTWSHATLYVGVIPGHIEPDGEPHVFIEADIEEGVISAPMSKYENFHTRICRPAGLAETETAKVCEFAMARLGNTYDMKNIADLMRYFLPTPPVPTRWRRRMIAMGAGSPTKTICSTLIAEAFQSVRYPILPSVESIAEPGGDADTAEAHAERQREILRIRHHSLFVPRDFDISPYFNIVKPSVEIGFDYRQLDWRDQPVPLPPGASLPGGPVPAPPANT
ncbi:MAG: lipo-like protein [Hyphomicrobiales bacterium]|nr:lipo-like protein [Hyphomicrobiales bacterium]